MPTISLARLAMSAVLFVCLAGREASAQNTQPHSAVHPLRPMADTPETGQRPVYYQTPPAPFGMAVGGDKWAVYSRGVNRINACVERATDTWLATDMGVKLIDHAHKTVTHFTRLDGLPEDRVIAVAADAQDAWAIVSTKHGENAFAALCEYRRPENRWRVLREVPRPVVAVPPPNSGFTAASYSPGSPLENSIVAACPEKLCFVLSPVRHDNTTMAYCYDRRLKLWDEIPFAPSFMLGRTTLSTTWLDADRDGLWLGTTAGLLHYRLREKKWQRLFADRMVYAAAKAGDGSLWLATYQPFTQVVDAKTPVTDSNLPAGRWSATHYMPKSGEWKQYPMPEAVTRQSAYGPRTIMTISGISIVGRNVWLTPGARSPFGYQSQFCSLAPQDETWKTYAPQNSAEMAAVPDAALAQPMLPRATLVGSYYPWRLAEWICHDGSEAPPDTHARTVATNRDADGTLWSTDGRALVHTDPVGTALDRFGLNRVPLAVTPQMGAVAVFAGALYATSAGDVLKYDLKTQGWRKVILPRFGWTNPADERLIPESDHLWIGTANVSLRYDPATDQFSTGSATQTSGFRLLGSIAGAVWLRGPDNLLYRSDPQTGEPETADIAPLPTELATRYDRGAPFGVAANIIWFRLPERKAADKCLYIGYEPETRTWTPGHAANKPTPTVPTCVGAGRRAFLPVTEDDSAIQCYDAENRKWSIAAAKEPQGHGIYAQTIVSVDDREIWSLDNSTRALMRYERVGSKWTLYEMPQTFYVQNTGNEAARDGDGIYVATNLGVWRFDMGTHGWTQLPGFASRDIYLNGIAVEPKAVWSIARPSNGNQAFAMRLDKTTRRWTAWSEKEGFPEKAYPNSIQPDGKTAWVLAGGECFHLDQVSNRWYDVSALLGRAKDSPSAIAALAVGADISKTTKVGIADVVPDNQTVWILPSGRPDATLLVRYDMLTGQYERLCPAGETNLVGRSMQIDRDAVWIPTSDGVFRYDRGNGAWRKVEPPAASQKWAKVETRGVIQRDRSYWFFGADDAVRWEQ